MYLPYGQVRSTTGTTPTDKGFTGQRLDATGLMFYGARYYSSALGRFISADTIVPGASNSQTLNRFAYTLNNPLKYIDPSGHCSVDGHVMADGSAACSWVDGHPDQITGGQYPPGNYPIPQAIEIKYGADGNWNYDLTWRQIADDPVELVTRAIMSEEGSKLLTDKWRDAEGAAWVIRNRFKDPNFWDTWQQAATSGLDGMKILESAQYAADPVGHPGYQGQSPQKALLAYQHAHQIALKVVNAPDGAPDPTQGALYYTDGYCPGNICEKDANGKITNLIPFERTHFSVEQGKLPTWCVAGVSANNCK
jgi:RHS repeat-associated protein